MRRRFQNDYEEKERKISNIREKNGRFLIIQ